MLLTLSCSLILLAPPSAQSLPISAAVTFTLSFLIFLNTTSYIILVTTSIILYQWCHSPKQSLPRLPIEKTQGVILAVLTSQNGMPTSRQQELECHIDKLGLPPRHRFYPAVSRVTTINTSCQLLLKANNAVLGAEVSQYPCNAAARGLMLQLGILIAAEEDSIIKLPQPTSIFYILYALTAIRSEPIYCYITLCIILYSLGRFSLLYSTLKAALYIAAKLNNSLVMRNTAQTEL